MEYLKPEEMYHIIMGSWKRARENKVSPYLNRPVVKISNNELEQMLRNNHNLIQLFKSSIGEISTLFKNEYIFILTNPQLILLDYLKSNKQKIQFLKKGMLFSDISIGTNAISLAQEIKNPVYLTPEYHYSDVFKECYCFAMPLIVDKKIIGFLDVSSVNKEIEDEMIAATKLLSELIVNKIKTYSCSKINNIKLTKKQRIILRYLVKGYTEQAVALEMGVCINTIKYHKKIIFRELKVDSTLKVIVKAIKMGILNVEEIDV